MEKFLQALYNKKINLLCEDKLLLKGARAGGFLVKFLYKVLDHSPDLTFPFRSIWNPTVPPKLGFFRLGCFLG